MSRRVITVSAVIFAGAILLRTVAPWVAPNADAPTAAMAVTSNAAVVLGVVAWAAGSIGVVAAARAGTIRRPAFRAAAITFAAFGLMAVALAVVIALAPNAPQEVLVVVWGVPAILSPALLITTGAVWMASPSRATTSAPGAVRPG